MGEKDHAPTSNGSRRGVDQNLLTPITSNKNGWLSNGI